MSIKSKRIVQFLLVNNISWCIAYPFVYVFKRLALSRENFLNRKVEEENIAICNEIFRERKVMDGLFKGMNMYGVKTTGSNLFAKLLGCYEELVMKELTLMLDKHYDCLINTGCDEGYYAVGIASCYPDMQVYAFDCNQKAQQQCRLLAHVNGLKDKFHIKGCFKFEEIKNIAETSKALFIIDCEGCENDIITPELVRKFNTADFIIELHYELYPNLLEKITALFIQTHTVKVITALSDHELIMQNTNAAISHLSFAQKKYILSERGYYTQWLIARSIA